MACSDNVVRAGLTPKYQDVETLVSMLEYSMVPAESRNFEGFKMDNYTILYNPPVLDFAVDMIEVFNFPITNVGDLTCCPGRVWLNYNGVIKYKLTWISYKKWLLKASSDVTLGS